VFIQTAPRKGISAQANGGVYHTVALGGLASAEVAYRKDALHRQASMIRAENAVKRSQLGNGAPREVRYSTAEKYCVERIFFLHGALNTVFFDCELAPT
jgi:hypothetical protein